MEESGECQPASGFVPPPYESISSDNSNHSQLETNSPAQQDCPPYEESPQPVFYTPSHPYSSPGHSYPSNQYVYTLSGDKTFSQPSQSVFPQVIVIGEVQQSSIHRSYGTQMALACVVFWCCGWLFGLVAFILAVMANNSDRDGNEPEAVTLGKASMWVSVAGIVIGFIVIAIAVGISASNKDNNPNFYG